MSTIAASLTTAHRYRDALVLGEASALGDILSQDVTVWSPIRFAPYRGRETAWRLLSAMDDVLERVALGAPLAGSSSAAIPFEAEVGGRRLQGLHMLNLDSALHVMKLTLFLRPASGLEAARRAMLEALGAPPGQ